MKKSSTRLVVLLVVLIALAGGIWLLRVRIHFDWANLALQLRAVNWWYVLAACAAINLSLVLRALRWRSLLGKVSDTSSAKLIPAQFVGFACVALFGRVADLARPYLLARKTKTPVATQLAVYSIERAFDLASAAILFTITLTFAPHDPQHQEAFARAGKGALALTLFLVVFALSVRFAGETLARLARTVFKLVSDDFAKGAATKILDFREGMGAISTLGQLASSLFWSMGIWVLIATAYLLTARSFRSSQELVLFTVSSTMLLLATSMGGSLLQLPVIGWFTQIALLAAALHGFFGVPLEVASACGAVLLLVTTLCVVPAGLIAAKIEGIGLRDAAQSAESVDTRTDAAPVAP